MELQETDAQAEEILSFNDAYYIECPEEAAPFIRHSIAQVAIRPSIHVGEHSARWGTNSWRGEYIFWDTYALSPNDQAVPEVLTFMKDKYCLKLHRLTRDLFEKKVRPFVAGGPSLTFNSDEELRQFFLRGKFERY